MGDLEAITGAAKNWTEYTFGSMLLMMIIWHYFTVKGHREEIKEWKDALKEERAKHDQTRDRHAADTNSIKILSESVDEMKDAVKEMSFDRRRA